MSTAITRSAAAVTLLSVCLAMGCQSNVNDRHRQVLVLEYRQQRLARELADVRRRMAIAREQAPTPEKSADIQVHMGSENAKRQRLLSALRDARRDLALAQQQLAEGSAHQNIEVQRAVDADRQLNHLLLEQSHLKVRLEELAELRTPVGMQEEQTCRQKFAQITRQVESRRNKVIGRAIGEYVGQKEARVTELTRQIRELERDHHRFSEDYGDVRRAFLDIQRLEMREKTLESEIENVEKELASLKTDAPGLE